MKTINEQFEHTPEVLKHLFRIADSYHAANSIHQAIELYFELAEAHAQTPEGQLAKQRLIVIGEEYEEQGNLHLSREIYERVMQLPGGKAIAGTSVTAHGVLAADDT
jgi:tetratricopeptide (TPR) repeat protein